MKENGFHRGKNVILEKFDPQPEIQKNAESARDWGYASEAKFLYYMANLFKDRFLDPILLTDRRRLPDPVISFDNLRNLNVLASYNPARNPQGLLYQITINTQNYVDVTIEGENMKHWIYGDWALLETLLHEQVHLWQQNFGEHPVKPGKSHHNKEFVTKCENLGLHPTLNLGSHYKLADGPFTQLMKEFGFPEPDLSAMPANAKNWYRWFIDTQGTRRKGQSSLNKWTCPECGLNARMGVKGDPQIRHEPCEQKTGHAVFFVRSDGLKHTIYKGK